MRQWSIGLWSAGALFVIIYPDIYGWSFLFTNHCVDVLDLRHIWGIAIFEAVSPFVPPEVQLVDNLCGKLRKLWIVTNSEKCWQRRYISHLAPQLSKETGHLSLSTLEWVFRERLKHKLPLEGKTKELFLCVTFKWHMSSYAHPISFARRSGDMSPTNSTIMDHT